ncbi:uncharacterized protein N7458_003472 [Penicillium daleae]|uniref:NADP-dependent oxidoreductase domain-containing protein n=1 Tax=Penicillium daleae TaxID=63821 RepID=A0AAD6G7R8_9EURO|nr:uncharacterized protein N7458_003472 [Penicillium daleae]KAJ5461920.1 hypothetical protein N7458_003472 [Penicillium daleae]
MDLPKTFSMRVPRDDPSWCTQAVVNALQAGYRHLDCAWEYGPHFAAPENVCFCLDQVLNSMGLDYVDLLLIHFPEALKPQGDLSQAKNFVGATAADQKAAVDTDGNYIPDVLHGPTAMVKLNGGEGSFMQLRGPWCGPRYYQKSLKTGLQGIAAFSGTR